MIRRNLLKTVLLTTVIATIIATTACGKKTANNNNTTSETKATVSAETKSNAVKELTKTELVTFNYTDADGNTYTLEGKAVATESGDTVIEVSDNNGNKVSFTGKAKTVDGKMTVSGITVKDAGTLVKADGTEIKVTTGTTVADAAKSDETTVSDITASKDVKQEVETSKKEEAIIEEAKKAVTKAEEIADNTTENSGSDSDDTIIADNGSNESSDNNQGNIGSSDNNDNAGNTDSNPDSSDNNNSDNNETPANPTPDETEDKKDETPAPAPADPEPTPAPVEPTPDNSKDDADSGNDFSTVEGPNGPMYAFTGDNYLIAGQDVNQGSNVDCPYALKTVTTRNAFLSNYGENAFRNITGYYYIALDEYGDEVPRGSTSIRPYEEELGWNYTESRKIGTFSCGDVWFCAYIGW